MSPVDGVINGFDEAGLESIRADGVEVSFDYGPGEHVEAMHNGTNRFGQLLVFSDDKDYVDELEQRVYRNVTVNGEPLSELWKR